MGVAPGCQDVRDAPSVRAAERVVEHLLLEVEHLERAPRLQPTGGVQSVVARPRPDLKHPPAGARG